MRGATSDKGSVLGPLCFLVYIAGLNSKVESTVKMFADDTTVYRKIACDADRARLQRDLDVLHEWSETWLLKFNIDKCKVMHFGQGEPIVKYTMNEINLEGTKEEKDLGVLISDNLQPSIQCANAAKKAMSVLALLQKSFKFFDEESFRILYKTYVRSHMETHIQAWAPYYKKDIQILEKVQRRATKLVPWLRKYPYEIQLQKLGILLLGQRRIRGDLIETLKS